MKGKEEERLFFREVPLVGNEKDGWEAKQEGPGGGVVSLYRIS